MTVSSKPHLANRPELRRLVKGLSALFWGMPLALLVSVQGTFTDWLRPLWLVPPVAATSLILYGVLELKPFRPDARLWQRAVERAKVFAIVNLGLSPFVYFVSRAPEVGFFSSMVGFMAVTGLFFLFMLNQSMQRLTDLWPDELLRTETRLFTSMNLTLMSVVLTFFVLFYLVQKVTFLPDVIVLGVRLLAQIRRAIVLFLILMPLAMTMTLLWKIKESVLREVFSPLPPARQSAEAKPVEIARPAGSSELVETRDPADGQEATARDSSSPS